MKRIGFLIAFVAAINIGCTERTDTGANDRAGDNASVGTAGDRDVSLGDKNFVEELAIANMAEVELGKMAAERGANAEVKKFGQTMADDHSKAGDSLKGVASQHNIEIPTSLDDKHRDLRDKLAKLQGAEFDREYIAAMVDGHQDVADQLESRIDQANLAQWKSTSSERQAGKAAEGGAEAPTVLPEKSDNPVTMSLNQWAADSYPVVQTHLETAKSLNDTVKGGANR